MSKSSTLKEIYLFIRHRKKWWLAPVIVVLCLIAGLIVLAEGSALAPFIYALF